MKSERYRDVEEIIVPILSSGGIGVLPTDTLYGLVGSALKKKTVEKIYKLRKRELSKPLIVLIGSFSDLARFGISISNNQKKELGKLWPGKVSVVLDCKSKKFEYLHRGVKTIAFRLPDDEFVLSVIKKTGPLVAPSANFAGEIPAESIKQAKKFFGDEIDFYVDAGKLRSKPSTLVRIEKDGELEILREGAVRINHKFKITNSK